ncbi:hypothetical protein EJ611_00980, partial [Pseudomonas aeruginosa]
TPARRPSVPHRTAGCGKSSLRPLMAYSVEKLGPGAGASRDQAAGSGFVRSAMKQMGARKRPMP